MINKLGSIVPSDSQRTEQVLWATLRLPLATYQALQQRAEELEGLMNRNEELAPWVPQLFDGSVRPWHVVERMLRKEKLKRNRATAYRARKREANATANKLERAPEST